MIIVSLSTVHNDKFTWNGIYLQTPPGGVIEVDEHGRPTGIVKERATELIAAAQQSQSAESVSEEARAVALEQKMRFIREGMALCARVGLTSVHTNDERSLE